MGYRASVITQHREYGSNIFSSYDDFHGYIRFLADTYPKEYDEVYVNENEDFYEIPRSILEQEIKRLEQLPPDDMSNYGSETSNSYLIKCLKRALDEAPANDDYVSLEWF